MADTTKKVMKSYMRALRATKVAFNGDAVVLNASRQKIREQFRKPDLSKDLDVRLKEMDDISTFLMRNVVQGKKGDENKYLLNIHKHTELGDNESLKKTKKVLIERGGGCCGGANAKI